MFRLKHDHLCQRLQDALLAAAQTGHDHHSSQASGDANHSSHAIPTMYTSQVFPLVFHERHYPHRRLMIAPRLVHVMEPKTGTQPTHSVPPLQFLGLTIGDLTKFTVMQHAHCWTEFCDREGCAQGDDHNSNQALLHEMQQQAEVWGWSSTDRTELSKTVVYRTDTHHMEPLVRLLNPQVVWPGKASPSASSMLVQQLDQMVLFSLDQVVRLGSRVAMPPKQASQIVLSINTLFHRLLPGSLFVRALLAHLGGDMMVGAAASSVEPQLGSGPCPFQYTDGRELSMVLFELIGVKSDTTSYGSSSTAWFDGNKRARLQHVYRTLEMAKHKALADWINRSNDVERSSERSSEQNSKNSLEPVSTSSYQPTYDSISYIPILMPLARLGQVRIRTFRWTDIAILEFHLQYWKSPESSNHSSEHRVGQQLFQKSRSDVDTRPQSLNYCWPTCTNTSTRDHLASGQVYGHRVLRHRQQWHKELREWSELCSGQSDQETDDLDWTGYGYSNSDDENNDYSNDASQDEDKSDKSGQSEQTAQDKTANRGSDLLYDTTDKGAQEANLDQTEDGYSYFLDEQSAVETDMMSEPSQSTQQPLPPPDIANLNDFPPLPSPYMDTDIVCISKPLDMAHTAPEKPNQYDNKTEPGVALIADVVGSKASNETSNEASASYWSGSYCIIC